MTFPLSSHGGEARVVHSPARDTGPALSSVSRAPGPGLFMADGAHAPVDNIAAVGAHCMEATKRRQTECSILALLALVDALRAGCVMGATVEAAGAVIDALRLQLAAARGSF